MKKLMIALCLVGSLCAFSQEPAAKPESEARPKMTQEQRKAMREKMQEQMKARRAAVQEKVVTILKEAGLDEAKAKDVAGQIEKAYMEGRPMHQRPGMGGPNGRHGGQRRKPAPETK